MNINWLYFSDTNTSPQDIKTLLERQHFNLAVTNQKENLNGLLNDSNQAVLFLNPSTLYNVYDLCEEISVQHPHVYIILIVAEELENLKKAMQVGASDTLRSSYNLGELAEAVAHAKKFLQQRVKIDATFISQKVEKSRVIAVTGPKGGVGRTLFTVNLAVAFAKMGKKVAVIDGNLQFGEVAIYYNIKPKRTIYEWVKEGYGHANYSIDQYMSTVDGDVSVLAAPPRPEFFEGISENHIKAAIEEVKKLFDIVLIDMPVHLSEIHLRCLDLADEILLTTVNEVSILRLSKLYLETLESIQLKGKVKLILNRHSKGQGLELKRIEDILALDVYHTLPDQVNVASTSIKTGQPFMLSSSRSHLGKAVWQLAEKLFENTSEESIAVKKENRWFSIGK
jgi:pilus assembly protein CpaE